MRRLITINLILLFSAVAIAQGQATADSTFLYKQAEINFQSLKWGITHLTNSKLEKVAYFGINYNHQNGHFRQAQQAEKTNIAELKSEGISTIDRFKLYGYFSFSRTWHDSLAFSQKGIEDAFTPYYFVSGKAGHFERQKYLGGGLISYNLLKDKLYIGTGIDYLYNSSARSVDPRSLVTTYRILFSPEISLKLRQHNFGVGFIAGYGDEKIDIGYKNDDFSGSLLYPDRISYLNYGYGYLEISTTDFIRRNTFTGLKLNYSSNFSTWDIAGKLNYLISKEDNQLVKERSINDETFGTFQLEKYQASLILNKKLKEVNHQIAFNATQTNGDDNLIRLRARNYTLAATDVDLTYSHFNAKASNNNYLWYIKAIYRDFFQKDAAANHTLQYSYVNPRIGTTIYWKNANNSLISTGLSLGSRLPLNSQVNVPATQVNSFTRGVTYPDYLYWSSKAAEVQLRINYTTGKLINKFRTGISLESTYLRSLENSLSNLDATFIPGKSYLDLNIAVNLYF